MAEYDEVEKVWRLTKRKIIPGVIISIGYCIGGKLIFGFSNPLIYMIYIMSAIAGSYTLGEKSNWSATFLGCKIKENQTWLSKIVSIIITFMLISVIWYHATS